MNKNLLRLAVVSGMLIAMNHVGYAQNWSLTGNAGTTPGTHFLGTTDAKGLHFKTKNTTRMAITNGGKFGIGLTAPSAKFQIENAANAYSVFSFSNDNNVAKDSIMVMTANGNIGIGTNAPVNKLTVTGLTNSTAPVTRSVVSYVGTSDIFALEGYSRPQDGWGYGVYGEGGYKGVYGYGNGPTYTGSVTGIQGYANAAAGTAYGVYGSGNGSSAENSWGGYFPTKTYTNELRVGGTTGATGYVAAINGKLIATEVRVQLQPWPDYVFAPGYNLPSISDLENSINTNNRLPGMPSACDVEENGLMLGEMQGKIVEKVEEQALYIIQLQKQIDELRMEIKAMKK